MRKEPITIYGDGAQGRCWIFISDLARANCMALKENARNEIMNLAGKEFVTISEIGELLKKAFGSIPIRLESPRPGDFGGVHTSIQKAQNLIGWSPEISFREGLSRYIEFVRSSQ
jgi:UDP-glucose 4-epimerase